MFNGKKKVTSAFPPNSESEDAVFLGWQKMASGKVLAIYNIVAPGHPAFGSTVTDKGLRKLNLQIPPAVATPGCSDPSALKMDTQK